MTIILYDSTFEGLLCAISAAIKLSNYDIEIKTNDYNQLSIQNSILNISTDITFSHKIYNRIIELWGTLVIENIYKAFLYSNTETLIYKYLYLLRNNKTDYLDILSHSDIIDLKKNIQSINKEVHRWYGFLRFKEIKTGYYYSNYEPTYDITNLLFKHFINRFQNHNFIIHDTKRKYAGIYYNKQITFQQINKYSILKDSVDEQKYMDMWKNYLIHLSIKERENFKRKMNLMPKKYWPFITEMNNQ